MKETTISIVPRIFKPYLVYNIPLSDVLEAIRTGSISGEDIRGITEKIHKEPDHSEQGKLKFWYLPAALFNGTFSYKNNESLISYSNATALDFDEFPSEEELSKTKDMLKQESCILSIYRTPSGKGLKALVVHDSSDPANHDELYDQLLKKFNLQTTDTSVKDLARGNYICYDPEIWINPDPIPFHFEHDINYIHTGINKSGNHKTSGTVKDLDTLRLMLSLKVPQGNKSDQSVINILNAFWKKKPDLWKPGHRANSVFSMASQLCMAGVNMDKALDYLVNEFKKAGLEENEILYHGTRGYLYNAESYGSTRQSFDAYGSKGRNK